MIANKNFRAGEVVERCYCLPVEKTHIPSSAQLLPEYLFRSAAALLFPFGWALLYNRAAREGDHNVSCAHEVRKDRQGKVRHYVLLRARMEVLQNTELLLSCSSVAGGMPSVALEACGARPPKPYMSEPFDFVDGVLPYSTGLKVKYSKLHGNGVYAKKAFKEGEMVEFAPSVLLMNTEMGGLLADYRYSAESLREGLFRVVLGCGSIYNHSAVPNLGYRRVRVDGTSEAVQGLSVCYYAKRDIAAGEEMLISYGKTWWSSRGIHDATAAAQLLLPSSSSLSPSEGSDVRC